MLSEAALLGILIALVRALVERALGLVKANGWNVMVVWQIEFWWSSQVDQLEQRGKLGPEAAATLRTALGDLAQRLDTVVAAGGDVAAVRAEVLRFREAWTGWARKVAITESTRVASEAVLASEAAQRPGAVKEWVSSHDTKVRPSHRDADGQQVPVGGTFMVGGFPMRYPGDPLGPPDEVVGCRCFPKIVVRKGS